jgi:hypothetical protein
MKPKKLTKQEADELREAIVKNNRPSPTIDMVLDLITKYETLEK